MEDEQTVVKSTAEGFEKFLEGIIWEDILTELKVWDERLVGMYDSCSTIEELNLIKGRREAVAYCMQLPYQIRDGLIDAKEREAESDNNEAL